MSIPPGEGCSRRGRRIPRLYNRMSPRRVMVLGLIFTPILGFAAAVFGAQNSPELAARRKRMVETQIAARGVHDPLVLRAMSEVPRHLFVPAGSVGEAYEDYPLPIGEGQTISQPYIVALMTERLALVKGAKVLEVGTGSGYQAAVLSVIAAEVFTVEINAELARQAAATLERLGYKNVHIRAGDGFFGWPEAAPFDGIIVTAAATEVPPALFAQLKEGGRMVIPLGDPRSFQVLTLVTKRQGKAVSKAILDVRFVPMTGEIQKKK
jgi:protein-L-isoaspartate(D-aspartate) O-methyltransferase